MHHRKHLHNIAKQSAKIEDWAACCSMRNLVNNQLECAHNAYYSKLFDDSFSGNRRQFWKYIQTRHKDSSTLLVNDQFAIVSDPKGKGTNFNQFSPDKI